MRRSVTYLRSPPRGGRSRGANGEPGPADIVDKGVVVAEHRLFRLARALGALLLVIAASPLLGASPAAAEADACSTARPIGFSDNAQCQLLTIPWSNDTSSYGEVWSERTPANVLMISGISPQKISNVKICLSTESPSPIIPTAQTKCDGNDGPRIDENPDATTWSTSVALDQLDPSIPAGSTLYYTFHFSNPNSTVVWGSYAPLSSPTEPEKTAVTPGDPSLEVLCDATVATVTVVPVPGVRYRVNGELVEGSTASVAVSEGGHYSVVVTAEPASEDYVLDDEAQSRWSWSGQVKQCSVPSSPNPNPGEPSASFAQQCVVTGGIDVTAEVTNPTDAAVTATFADKSMAVPANSKAAVTAHVAAKAHVELLVDGTVIGAVTAEDDICATQVEGVKITASPTPKPSTSVKGVKLADTGASFPLSQAVLVAGLLLGAGALLLAMPTLSTGRRRRH